FVGLGGRGDGDIHTAQRVDLIEVDFREDDLFLDTEVVITTAIEGTAGDTTEVARTRQRDVDQAVQEFPHLGTTERDLAADRPTVADLERSDRHAGLRRDRLLAGGLCYIGARVFARLLVTGGFAAAP